MSKKMHISTISISCITELGIENDEGREKKVHLWCSRFDVARRLADKLMVSEIITVRRGKMK